MTAPEARYGRAGALLPALLIAVFAVAAGAAVFYAPPTVGQMAVVFAPGVSEAQALGAVIAAGGRFVGPTRFGNIVIAYGSDSQFAARVRSAGALFTLAAQGLCSPVAPVTNPI